MVGLSRTWTVNPITAAATATPMSRPICWYFGVAPTRYPVLRSCEVAPALAAAMHTMPPTQRAIGWGKASDHPSGGENRDVPISAAMGLAEKGGELAPIPPARRQGPRARN